MLLKVRFGLSIVLLVGNTLNREKGGDLEPSEIKTENAVQKNKIGMTNSIRVYTVKLTV